MDEKVAASFRPTGDDDPALAGRDQEQGAGKGAVQTGANSGDPFHFNGKHIPGQGQQVFGAGCRRRIRRDHGSILMAVGKVDASPPATVHDRKSVNFSRMTLWRTAF